MNAWLKEMRTEAKPLPVFVIRVDNSSAEPAYGVLIRLVYGNSGTFVRDIGVLGPEEAIELDIVVSGLRPIDPTLGSPIDGRSGRRISKH